MGRRMLGILCLVAAFAYGAHWLDESGGAVKRDAKGNITEVSLRHSWVSDSDLLALAQIPTITKLDLAETRITDLGFQHLKKLPAVTDVNLYYAELLGDEALAAMKTWKNLQTLNAGERRLRTRDWRILRVCRLSRLMSVIRCSRMAGSSI